MSFKQKLENKKKKYKLKLSNLENNNSSMISKDKKSINKLPILKNNCYKFYKFNALIILIFI